PEYSDYFNKKVQNNQQRLHHSPEKKISLPMEVFVALSCYTLYIENRKNLEVVRMNNQRPMFINILLVVLLFLVVGSLFSAVVG
ncbi:hypothetical protein ACQP3F_33115, partial [Escherichia coli]